MFSKLIKSDIEKIIENANFNDEQEQIFIELTKPTYHTKYTDIFICHKLNLSESKYYRIKKEIKEKIKRIMDES